MKRTTRKLSGDAKDRFLTRFYQSEPGLDAELAERLAARSKAAFTSLRIRPEALAGLERKSTAPTAPTQQPIIEKPAPNAPAAQPPASQPPPQDPPPRPAKAATVASATTTPQSPTEPFDPYCIGLVPVFQREGRDGLISKLRDIDDPTQLRQMAKVQKIVLPQELRTGDQDAVTLRSAIADAVARRIADRRAAAG